MAPAARLGVMGGTFDPIHYGHLFAAEEAAYRFELERVLFIPVGVPPHKATGESLPAEERYRMTAIAVEGNPRFEASRFELERPGKSFTIDTMRELRDTFPAGTQLFFIVGSDSILDIKTWKQPAQLLEEFPMVVATRPGYDLHHIDEVLPDGVKWVDESGSHVMVVEIPGLDISSTEIRRRVSQGRPTRYMLPEAVRLYIDEKGFYR